MKLKLIGLMTGAITLLGSFFLSHANATGPSFQEPAWSVAAAGPFAVTQTEYDFGDDAFRAPSQLGAAVEVRSQVFHPSSMQLMAPHPLIVILHGRHATCYRDSNPNEYNALYWPCPNGWTRINSQLGYDYLGSYLASHGYIVASISANGITVGDSEQDPPAYALWRAELIQHHLERWAGWNNEGGYPFYELFRNKVNLQRVGLLGHSRGGEGAVRFVSLNTPFGISAVFPLVSTGGTRIGVTGTPLNTLISYCDGDVFTEGGVHFFDDGRYEPNLTSPRHMIVVMGANHNYFNRIWSPESGVPGSRDDWTHAFGNQEPYCNPGAGSQRLSESRQRDVLVSYAGAFFRSYTSSNLEPNSTQFLHYLTGESPPPSPVQDIPIHVSYQARSGPEEWRLDGRLDVNRLVDSGELETNTLSGDVEHGPLLSRYMLCGGAYPQPRNCLPEPFYTNINEPHTSASEEAVPGLSQLDIRWEYQDYAQNRYANEIPEAHKDVRRFRSLQFRVGVNFSDGRNPGGQPQDMKIVLKDRLGNSSSVFVSQLYGPWPQQRLYYPPGGGTNLRVLPHLLLNTVRVTLSPAQFPGVNLAELQWIEFPLNLVNNNKKVAGALNISDITLANDPCPSPRCVDFSDVPVNSTFYSYVGCLACRNIITGYPCGGSGEPCPCSNTPYFRPDADVTRGQVAKIVSAAADFREDPGPQLFEDVPTQAPFYAGVNRLARRNIIGGYECGNLETEPCVPPNNLPYFRPYTKATRGQISKTVSNAAYFNDYPTPQRFEDVPPGSTFYDYVQRLASRGIMGGYPCGTMQQEPCVPLANRPYFRSGNDATRGQTSKITANTFLPSCLLASSDDSPADPKTQTTPSPERTGTPDITPPAVPSPWPTVPLPIPSLPVPPPVPSVPASASVIPPTLEPTPQPTPLPTLPLP